jgi:hypothetical protein
LTPDGPVSLIHLWVSFQPPKIRLTVDPDAISVDGHPSTRRPREEFSGVKIDAKDWTNLLRVSVVAKSMLACMSASHGSR